MTLPLLLAAALAAAPEALVIGEDQGLPGEMPLRFAETDAALVARSLREVAGVPDPKVLQGRSLSTLRRALAALGRNGAEPAFVFYSGHGGPDGVHVGGEVWPWAEIRAGLAAIPAPVVVAFFDSCESGLLLVGKGLARAPPLALTLEPAGPRGRLLFASSGADESSYESARLAGSPFAHALVSGLRGDADANGDGRVTVAELYDYLYGRTLAETLAAPGGPQHPMERVDLRGAGDVVLARTADLPALSPAGAPAAQCYALDAGDREVLGEIGPRPLALPAGSYHVKCRRPDGGLLAADAALTRGRLALGALSYEEEPPAYALAKGGAPPVSRTLELGAGALLPLPGTVLPAGRLRYRQDVEGVGWDLELGDAGAARPLWATAGIEAEIPWWNLGGAVLWMGLGAGGALLPERHTGAFLMAPELALRRPLGDRWYLSLQAQLFQLLPTPPSLPSSSLLLGAGLGLRL